MTNPTQQPPPEQIVLTGQFRVSQPWKRGRPVMSVATLTNYNIIRFHEADDQGNIANQTPYVQFNVADIAKCGLRTQYLELTMRGEVRVGWLLDPAVQKGDTLKNMGAGMLGGVADTGLVGKLFMGRSNKLSHKVSGAVNTSLNVAIQWREKLEELGVKAQILE
jgi:hypothetical protein